VSDPSPELTAFRERVAEVGAATLNGLRALEVVARHLHPKSLPTLREQLVPLRDRLAEAHAPLLELPPPEGGEGLRDALAAGAGSALSALEGFCTDDGAAGPAGVPRILEAMRDACRAQERLYPLRFALPPLGTLYAEEPWHPRLHELDPEPPPGVSPGLYNGGEGRNREVRGGFVFYLPETTDGKTPLPLVVALHGGYGHGADFLWTWLREARSRRFMLLAPTSRSTTWSLQAPAAAGKALASMVAFLGERFPVDPTRVLLTGLSDGATFSLLAGLAEDAPYTALAPVSGVLHPLNMAAGNLARAADRPIYLVHGAQDWMFPVALARMARDELEKAGARLVYREIEDLSHTYPREENARILEWFDPSLALPTGDASGPS
jgi:phospholipase/carboxylesterase